MNNKEYGVKLDLDISSFKANLRKATDLTKKAKENIEKPLRKVKVFNNGEETEIKVGVDTSKIEKQLDETIDDFEKKMANVKPKIFDHTGVDVNAPTIGYDVTPEEETFWKNFSNSEGPFEDVNISLNELKENTEEAFTEATNNITNKVEELASKYAELVQKYKELTNPSYGELIAESDIEEAEKLKTEIQQIISEMEELTGEKYVAKGITEPLQEAKRETIGVVAVFSNFGDVLSRSINRGVTSLKRFGLSMLGIHGLYTVLTRASNAYMAQDETLHTKMQANWIALGAVFAPIIEKLIVLFQRLVAYVNVFWKALTGKNLIAQAFQKVEKSSQKTTKAVKELSKELSNIDEITNLNFDQGTNNLGDAGGGDYGIADALKELDTLQLNPKVVEVIQNIAKFLKDAWNWCVKIKDKLEEWGISLNDIIALIGVVFGASQVGRIVSGIAQIIGVSGGTAGLYGMITALAIIDVYLGVTLYNKIKELGKAWEEQAKAEERLGNSRIKTLNIAYEQIEKINEELKNSNLTEEQRNKLESRKKELINEARKSYQTFNKEAKDGVNYSKAQKAEMEEMRKKLEQLTGKKWKSTYDVEVNTYQSQSSRNWWDNFINSVRGVLSPIKGKNGGGGGTGFAKGNVAYQPTYAQFGEYAGARSNPEITAPQSMMRETLYEALSDALPLINNNRGGDTILYVNGKELARATYSDFREEGNRLGSSNIMIRRR